MSKKACEWIELDPQNYMLTFKVHSEDAEKRQAIDNSDAGVRNAIEAASDPLTHTEEEVIKAAKMKFKRDMDMYRKLQSLKFTTS